MKLNAIDLNKIPIFTAVVKLGNYTLASEELHLTKSAISQAISTLESQLGKSLFLRIRNKLVPTEEGLAFYNDLVQYEVYLQKALDRLQGESQGLTGELVIGCYYEFAKNHLPPCLKKFLRNAKNARIKFRFEAPSKLDDLLVEGKIDLSLSIYPHKGAKGIKSFKLFKEELVLIAHNNLLNSKVNKEVLAQTPIIDYYADHQLILRWVRSQFGRAHFEPLTRVYAATAEMVGELVRQQIGVGVVPYYVAEPLLLKECQVINSEGPKLFDYIWVNTREERRQNLLKEEFLRVLIAHFQQTPRRH